MKKLFALFILSLLIPSTAFATIGVGVGTGKIQVEDQLKPGVIYELPPLSVINTGDEPSNYEVDVTYHENQPELRPPKSWFSFSPREFYLEPGDVQIVDVKLNLPVRSQPGDYFAYLEGRPAKKVDGGGNTTIGVAAAAKLYFTATPGNIFEGLYYKALTFWQVYSPWTERAAIAIILVGAFLIFKRFFNININFKPKTNEDKGSDKDKNKEKEKKKTVNEISKKSSS